jgi:hypothetical protein
MLVKLFPRTCRRYLSLPLFGPVMDDFDDWLLEQGYARSSRRRLLLPNVAQLDRQLRRRGVNHIKNLTPLALQRCWDLPAQTGIHLGLDSRAGSTRLVAWSRTSWNPTNSSGRADCYERESSRENILAAWTTGSP